MQHARRSRRHEHQHNGQTTQAGQNSNDSPGPGNSEQLANIADKAKAQRVDNLSRFVAGGGVIDLNAEGPGIIELQQLMGKLGFPVQATGVFGPTTQATLRKLQESLSVQATGQVGPTTLDTLKSALNVGTPLGNFDAYSAGQHLGSVPIFEVDGVRMTRETAQAWKKMKAAALSDGVHLKLNSGFRTMDEQQQLWNAHQNGTGNPAAYPGYSNHQNGIALDIDVVSDASYNWMYANGTRFGFKDTVAGEPWHWEYRR